MKRFAFLSIVIALLASGVPAQSPEPTPAPPKDQEWLKQLVGEWDALLKMYVQPDQPPAEAAGSDSVRALGEHWIIAETKSTMMGAPFSGILSLGYDAQQKQFHGTWIDSFGGHLWVYKGTLSEAGDALTLETEGPSMLEGLDKTARYKEVIQITGNDSRTFTSSIETDDGTWMKILTVEYRRKKERASTPSSADRGQTQADARGLGEKRQEENTLNVHYLEIVTSSVDETCNALEKAHGVTFGEPVAELGHARTATLNDGGRIGVRALMGEEQPVVRPYVLVDDIHAAVKAAEAAGAEVLMPPTEAPGLCTFAIYYLGKIEHGLWQR